MRSNEAGAALVLPPNAAARLATDLLAVAVEPGDEPDASPNFADSAATRLPTPPGLLVAEDPEGFDRAGTGAERLDLEGASLAAGVGLPDSADVRVLPTLPSNCAAIAEARLLDCGRAAGAGACAAERPPNLPSSCAAMADARLDEAAAGRSEAVGARDDEASRLPPALLSSSEAKLRAPVAGRGAATAGVVCCAAASLRRAAAAAAAAATPVVASADAVAAAGFFGGGGGGAAFFFFRSGISHVVSWVIVLK